MPGNGFALTVLIGSEVEMVSVLQQALEVCHLLLLVGVYDVQGLEIVVDVDACLSPRLTLVGVRHVGGPLRQITHVADRGLHDKAIAQVTSDRLGLRR